MIGLMGIVVLDVDLIVQFVVFVQFECGLFAPKQEWQLVQIIVMQLGLQIVVQPEEVTLVHNDVYGNG